MSLCTVNLACCASRSLTARMQQRKCYTPTPWVGASRLAPRTPRSAARHATLAVPFRRGSAQPLVATRRLMVRAAATSSREGIAPAPAPASKSFDFLVREHDSPCVTAVMKNVQSTSSGVEAIIDCAIIFLFSTVFFQP